VRSTLLCSVPTRIAACFSAACLDWNACSFVRFYSTKAISYELYSPPRLLVVSCCIVSSREVRVTSMVCRITITGNKKDVVVDIHESINSLGLSKISTETDTNRSAKRRRTPSNSIGSKRSSPYLPRTPTSPQLPRVPQAQENEAIHKSRSPETWTLLSTSSTTSESRGFLSPPPLLSPEQGQGQRLTNFTISQ
jgi:hypothetical protein